jgi:hypothetical protein
MGVFGWLRGKRGTNQNGRLDEWRREWREASGGPQPARIAELTRALEALGLPEEEIEIEREMLDALEQLAVLQTAVAGAELPVVTTGHRVVGTDVCHFTAPASMPDDAAQPSGRLILTSARAIFVGGARATTVPWHMVSEATHADRDVVLVKHDRESFYRFRCNSYADALCCSFLSKHLADSRRR